MGTVSWLILALAFAVGMLAGSVYGCVMTERLRDRRCRRLGCGCTCKRIERQFEKSESEGE